jgi:DNA-binding transcriptional MocR family regulator
MERVSKKGSEPDKLNQLRHVRLLQSSVGLEQHMGAHRALLAPKFSAILDALSHRLDGFCTSTWSVPRGGYFISIEAAAGTARRAVELAAEAGVVLTVAGSTWPYGRDPRDSNIRVAPSHASLADVRLAADIIALSILLAAAEQQHADRTGAATLPGGR